jgi:hypothetical protein
MSCRYSSATPASRTRKRRGRWEEEEEEWRRDGLEGVRREGVRETS